MQERNRISNALAAAVLVLPIDICRLIADYGRRRHHVFNGRTGTPAVHNFVLNAGGSVTVFRSSVDDFDFDLFTSNNRGHKMFISDVSLLDGQLDWHVDLHVDINNRGNVQFGLTNAADIDELFYDRFDSTVWSLSTRTFAERSDIQPTVRLDAVHDDGRLPVLSTDNLFADESDVAELAVRLQFTTDAVTGTIRIGWSTDQLDASPESTVIAWFGNGRPKLADLRPYVILLGSTNVVFRSGDDAGFAPDRFAVFLKTIV